MTTLKGDTGKVSLGTLKDYTFTYNPEQKSMADVLPTSTPADAQVVHTILESMLVVEGGYSSYTKIPYIVCGGRNTSGVVGAVYYEIYKNGTLVNSGNRTTITNTNYWTLCFGHTTPCEVGDVFSVKLWANNESTSLTYSAAMIWAVNIDFGVGNSLLSNLTPLFTKPQDLLVGIANPGNSWQGGWYFHPTTGGTTLTPSSNMPIPFISLPHPTYKFGNPQAIFGNSIIGINIHASSMPHIQQSLLPSRITFREVFL